jgi:hypothetical protein
VRKCTPGRLSIFTPDGKRRYTGDHAVADAILAGERYLRASTSGQTRVWIRPPAHGFRTCEVKLTESIDALKNNAALLKQTVDRHQEALKQKGDWVIFPQHY